MRAAAASSVRVAAAARGFLRTGNAVDAVIAGVLAAAAESSSVLFGPIQLLAGGPGAGLLALDGRVRQPGLGAPRPRGFIGGEAIPPSALVAVPALPAAVATAAAVLGSMSLTRAAGPAIELARMISPERAWFIEKLGRRGARALTDEAVASELMAVAGRSARGILTREDLASVVPAVVACPEATQRAGGVITAPWRGDGRGDSSVTQVVAACDGHGLVAVACYEAGAVGLAIPALGVVAPPLAAPVLRGSPRIRPGEPRPATAPVALRVRAGVVDLAIGVGGARDAEQALDRIMRSLEDSPSRAGTLSISGKGTLLAIAVSRDASHVLASG